MSKKLPTPAQADPDPDMLDKAGQPITPRIQTPQQVRDIHLRNWEQDRDNRRLRAQVERMLACAPPFDQARLDAAGLSHLCANVSSGYGRLAISRKLEPYVQALNTMPVLLNIVTRYGSPEEKMEWNEKMSANHRKMLKHWRPFRSKYLRQALYCISHGASFGYFPDDSDWRWDVATTGDMVVDRLTKADTTDFDTVSTEVEFKPSEIWDHIKNLSGSEQWSKGDRGWFAPVARNVIEAAAGKDFFKQGDPELAVRKWEGRDFNSSAGSSTKVCACILMWQKETDGTVTQYIVPKKAESKRKAEEFLFKQSGFYKSMEDGLVTFVRDIGTNGYFHSIRGTGANIYESSRRMDVLKCRMDDAVSMELSIMVRGTEEAMQGEPFVYGGPLMFLRDGIDVITDRRIANYSTNAIPILQQFRQEFMEQQGSYQQPNVPDGKDEFGEKSSPFSGADVMEYSLWHDSWERLLVQSFGRVRELCLNGTSSMPGGMEAWLWKKWCLEDGVPIEAIEAIDLDECFASKPIGAGSPQAALFAMNTLMPLAPAMDEQGRNTFYRTFTSFLPGMDESHVDAFWPKVPNMRPSQEVRNAQYENFILMNGGQAEVQPNDNHIIHIQEALTPMLEIQQAVESGEMDVAEAVQPLYPLYMHTEIHLEAASQDKVMKNQVAELAQAVHNMGEIITNGQRKALKLQEDAQRQQQEAQIAQQQAQQSPQGEAGAGQPQQANPLVGTVNEPMAQFQGLSLAQWALFSKTQASVRSAQRNEMERQALHDKRVEILERQAQQRELNEGQRRKLNDYKTAVGLASV